MAIKTFSLSQEALDRINEFKGNKSELVTSLIINHFGERDINDLEKLNEQKIKLNEEIDILIKRKEHITHREEMIIEKEKEERKAEELQEAKKEYQRKVADVNALYDNSMIDQKEYFKRIDDLRKEKPGEN